MTAVVGALSPTALWPVTVVSSSVPAGWAGDDALAVGHQLAEDLRPGGYHLGAEAVVGRAAGVVPIAKEGAAAGRALGHNQILGRLGAGGVGGFVEAKGIPALVVVADDLGWRSCRREETPIKSGTRNSQRGEGKSERRDLGCYRERDSGNRAEARAGKTPLHPWSDFRGHTLGRLVTRTVRGVNLGVEKFRRD